MRSRAGGWVAARMGATNNTQHTNQKKKRTNALLVCPRLQLLHCHRRAVVAVRANFPKGAATKGGTTTATATAGTARLDRQGPARAVHRAKAARGDQSVRRHPVRPFRST